MKVRATAAPGLASRARQLAAREAVRGEVTGFALFAIELLVTELVTNALRHGPADGVVEVEATRRNDRLEVSVSDDSPEPPVIRRPGPDAPGGRGMALVEALALRWGVRQHADDGKSVWFWVDLHMPEREFQPKP